MPFVQFNPNPDIASQIELDKFGEALREFIPAALNCTNTKHGRLTPGNIVLVSAPLQHTLPYMPIHIDAYRFKEREFNINERSAAIVQAMEETFPGFMFDVKITLSTTRRLFKKVPDSTFDGDMSMEAAIKRYRDRLEA